MSLNVVKFAGEVKDKPIDKPSEPLPSIFSSVRHSGFSTLRQVRLPDVQKRPREVSRSVARGN